jgi:uncharacterized protein YggE
MQNLLPRWLTWSLGLLVIVVLGLIALDKSYTLKNTLENKNPQNTLSVTAEGKVKAVPDLASIDLGVLTNASTAAEAQDQSAKKINAIIEFVKKQGVGNDDIATSQFNIYPQQDYREGKSTITGYTANQSINIKVRGIDKSTDTLTKILGGVTGAGANQINGVNLTFDDPDNFRGQARERAIAKAQEKAQELARAAGLRLGRVINVSETGSSFGPIPYAEGLGYGGGGDMRAVAPNVQPGNQDIVANMTVVFEVK